MIRLYALNEDLLFTAKPLVNLSDSEGNDLGLYTGSSLSIESSFSRTGISTPDGFRAGSHEYRTVGVMSKPILIEGKSNPDLSNEDYLGQAFQTQDGNGRVESTLLEGGESSFFRVIGIVTDVDSLVSCFDPENYNQEKLGEWISGEKRFERIPRVELKGISRHYEGTSDIVTLAFSDGFTYFETGMSDAARYIDVSKKQAPRLAFTRINREYLSF